VNVLVVNAGSSSLKYELFDMTQEQSLAKGLCERVGGEGANVEQESHDGRELEIDVEMPDHSVAFERAIDALTGEEAGVIDSLDAINAVGHRVVHGGEDFASSVVIDERVEDAIDRFGDLAPLHNPPNLMGIRAAKGLLPDAPHVAVFDTAFHQTMPRHAFTYGLPWEMYAEHGIRRYGFHGTSHRYVALRAGEYLREQGIANEDHKIVTCHLGNGCSAAAVQGGRSVDTTMGLTPLEGLVMGTRCGDIDPALPFLLSKNLGMGPAEIYDMLNRRSGLAGLSGVGNDMREVVQAAARGNERAERALEVFCYRIKKYVGAYLAVLGRLDALVFTAGIGENCPEVRRRACRGLEPLGICLDPERNPQTVGREGVVSRPDSPTAVLVTPTNEELKIAVDTYRIYLRTHNPEGDEQAP
jgi:acetate kinase